MNKTPDKNPSKNLNRNKAFACRVKKLFQILEAADPNPETELNFINAYTLLVAVALSAQATDKSVNKATASLFEKVTTPAQMVKLGEEKLKNYIKTIGLYNSKAKNVIALSRMLVEQFGGKVPADAAALQTLPGVGRKTADVVMNVVFKQPTIAVDTHIFRVSNRTGLAPGATADKVADMLQLVVPDQFKLHAHHWLILHGRYICVARTPKCEVCPITQYCDYYKTVVWPQM